MWAWLLVFVGVALIFLCVLPECALIYAPYVSLHVELPLVRTHIDFFSSSTLQYPRGILEGHVCLAMADLSMRTLTRASLCSFKCVASLVFLRVHSTCRKVQYPVWGFSHQGSHLP